MRRTCAPKRPLWHLMLASHPHQFFADRLRRGKLAIEGVQDSGIRQSMTKTARMRQGPGEANCLLVRLECPIRKAQKPIRQCQIGKVDLEEVHAVDERQVTVTVGVVQPVSAVPGAVARRRARQALPRQCRGSGGRPCAGSRCFHLRRVGPPPWRTRGPWQPARRHDGTPTVHRGQGRVGSSRRVARKGARARVVVCPISGAAMPLEAIRGEVRSMRRRSSLRSRSTDGGRLSSKSRAFESWAIASTVADRFEARWPARCQ